MNSAWNYMYSLQGCVAWKQERVHVFAPICPAATNNNVFLKHVSYSLPYMQANQIILMIKCQTLEPSDKLAHLGLFCFFVLELLEEMKHARKGKLSPAEDQGGMGAW